MSLTVVPNTFSKAGRRTNVLDVLIRLQMS